MIRKFQYKVGWNSFSEDESFFLLHKYAVRPCLYAIHNVCCDQRIILDIPVQCLIGQSIIGIKVKEQKCFDTWIVGG